MGTTEYQAEVFKAEWLKEKNVVYLRIELPKTSETSDLLRLHGGKNIDIQTKAFRYINDT